MKWVVFLAATLLGCTPSELIVGSSHPASVEAEVAHPFEATDLGSDLYQPPPHEEEAEESHHHGHHAH